MVTQHDNNTACDSVARRRRLLIWIVGIGVILCVIALQLPQLRWSLEYGLDFEPGKSRIATLRNLLTLLIDAASIVFWTKWRPGQWWWALVIGPVLAFAWGSTTLIAIVLSAVLSNLS